MKGDAKSLSFVEDTAVAPERLRDYIRDFLALVDRHGTTAGVYAHASVGCLHVRPVIDLKTAAGVAKFEAIASDVADLVLTYGGALSGEHGDGLVRSPFMERMFGPSLYDAFRQIKRTFDPDGSSIPARSSTRRRSRRTCGTARRIDRVACDHVFDYTEHGGFAGAVEMCSGLGACRKTQSGHDVPVVHGDARRGALDARPRERAAAGARRQARRCRSVRRRACTRCSICASSAGRARPSVPVGVDVARMKSEFLSAYWRRRGMPAHARVLGHVDRLARWGSRFAPISNVLSAKRARPRCSTNACSASIAGAAPPAWDRQTFRRRFVRRHPDRPADRRALRGHVHQSLPPGDRSGGARRDRAARVRRHARAERLLRPAAHLAGPARRSPASRARERRTAVSARRTRTGARVSRAELSLRHPRGRAGPARGRRSREGPGRRGARAPVRGLARGGMPRRSSAPHARVRARDGRAPRPLPPEGDGRPGVRRRRCSRAFPARPSSIPMPAAAAWPGRSATCASTSRSRAPSASGDCCRRRARWPRCRARGERHVVPAADRRLHRRSRAARRRTRADSPDALMNLAIALRLRARARGARQLRQPPERRRAVDRAGVDRRRLHRRAAGQHGDGRLSEPAVPDAGRRDAALRDGAVERHAVASSRTTPCASAAATPARFRSCSSCSARRCRRWGPATSRRRRCSRRSRWPRRRAPASRCS